MPATDPDFAAWKRDVDTFIARHFQLSLDDLPDMMTRAAFDDGESPWDFFDNQVKDVMLEEFGEDVLLLWPSSPTD